ncbi:MAG: TRAP transporter fused permease subunit [Alphaproteobacteria bacterium]
MAGVAGRRFDAERVTEENLARETGEIVVVGASARLTQVLLLSWSLLQLYLASGIGAWFAQAFGFGIVNDIYARALHLFFGGILCFLMFSARKGGTLERRTPWYDYVLGGVIGLACLWQAFNFAEIIDTSGRTRDMAIPFFGEVPFEFVLGWVAIFVTLEAARRVVGLPLAVIGCLFIAYTLFNQYLPPPFGLSDVSAVRYVTTQWYGQEGIFGIPLGVSTKTIFLFVLFGALLEKGGAGKWFIDMAFAAVGHLRGGPAKSAVLASGLTGMISGSSIANTVTTGTFTIPIMKRNGYPAVKAGAVEVAASVNGQIMPPIMGAAAFVMAEILGVSYFTIIKHAFIPAVISYIALFYIVHLEALKLGLKPGIRPEAAWIVLRRGWHYLIPIVVLVYVLTVLRNSPDRAAFYCILTLVLVFFVERVVEFRGGIVGLRTALYETYRVVVAGLSAGSRNMVSVSIAVAAAGLVLGSIGASGLSNALQEILTFIAGDSIFPILLATALLSIILGMGLPTTANYLIVSTLMVGIISNLGRQAGFDFPLVAIHLFCFYFGLMADVTPPVGLASFAAASISRADPIRTGIQAFWYSGRTAILPFVFLFNVELLLIDVDSWLEGGLVFVMSLLAILGFTALTQGWMLVRLRAVEYVVLGLAVLILFRPGFLQNMVFPVQLEQVEHSALESGIEADSLRFTTIDLLDQRQSFEIRAEKKEEAEEGEKGEVISWSSLGLGAGESFLHEGGTQITLERFSGAGAKAGFLNGMTVLTIERVPARASKYWFYLPGLFALILVWGFQWRRGGRGRRERGNIKAEEVGE